jgi:hypothetical protein
MVMAFICASFGVQLGSNTELSSAVAWGLLAIAGVIYYSSPRGTTE